MCTDLHSRTSECGLGFRSIQSYWSVVITSSGDGADAGEPIYVSGGKVPKYSDVREVVYVIGCVLRIMVSPHSSSSHCS